MARPKKKPKAAAPSGEVPLATLADVAHFMECSTRALQQWREKYADAPTGNLVSEWKAFKARHNLGERIGNRVSKSREEILTEKAAAETRLAQIKIAKEERKLIDSDQVDSFLLFLSSRLKAAMYQQFETEIPPRSAHKDVAEVRKANVAGCDTVCRSMQTALTDWQAEQDAAREAVAQVDSDDGEA